MIGLVLFDHVNDDSCMSQNKNDKSSILEFKNEILTLSKIEHLNLVRLLGYAEDKDERIIAMEYVANGTLREHLDGMFRIIFLEPEIWI